MHPVLAERNAVRQRIAQKKGELRRLRSEIAADAVRLRELDAQCDELRLGVPIRRVGVEETHGHR